MLDELNSMDANVVTSIRGLVSSCRYIITLCAIDHLLFVCLSVSVLDWTSYERNYMSSGYNSNMGN